MKFHLAFECEDARELAAVLKSVVRDLTLEKPLPEDEGRIESRDGAFRKIGEWYWGDGEFRPVFPAAARADGERAGKGEA